jgi:hypothetical protein
MLEKILGRYLYEYKIINQFGGKATQIFHSTIYCVRNVRRFDRYLVLPRPRGKAAQIFHSTIGIS